MRIPAYLSLSRHNVFYFRWPLYGRTVRVSLRTRNPRLALHLARNLAYHAENITEQMLGMDYIEIKRELQAFFIKWLDNRKREINQGGTLAPQRLETFRSYLQELELSIQRGEDDFTPDGSLDELLDMVIRVRKLDIEKGTAEYGHLQHEYKFAYAQYCRDTLAYNESIQGYNLTSGQTPILTLKPSKVTMPLKQAIEDYMEERRRGGAWRDRTESNRRAKFEVLLEIAGEDTDIAAIDAQKVLEIKKFIQSLPKNISKNPLTRDLPLHEAVKVEGAEKLNINTVNEYLTTYQGLFNWATDNGFIDKPPVKDWLLRKGKNDDYDKREAFTHEQVRTILQTLPKENATRYWGVMLGVYTGARLNEITQLTLDDIRQENGVWYFDINDEGDDKQLKNKNSKRLVPVHSVLLSAGLLEHVTRLKKAKHARLFPDLKVTKTHKAGRNLGHWFNTKCLVSLGLKNDKLSFHSFRHTFATALLNAGVPDGMTQELLGHSKKTVTQSTYNKGYSVAVLKEAIEKLPY